MRRAKEESPEIHNGFNGLLSEMKIEYDRSMVNYEPGKPEMELRNNDIISFIGPLSGG